MINTVAREPLLRTPATVECAGLVVADLFVPPLDRIPRAGELVMTGDFLSGVGGCAANTATVLAHLGVRTIVCAKVGQDSHGEWLRRKLEQRGIDTAGITVSPDLSTSQTVILPVIGDDRRYIHAVGANAALTGREITNSAAGVRVVAIGGYLALPALTASDLISALAKTRASGAMTVLDVVIPSGRENLMEDLRPVLPYVDCFLPNRDEGRDLCSHRDPIDQALTFLEWGCSSVVITSGSDGALYADRTQIIEAQPLSLPFVDGSGAGDAFAAGIIVGLLEQWPVEKRLAFAAALGASVTRGLGCSATLFTREEALAAIDLVSVSAVTRTHTSEQEI